MIRILAMPIIVVYHIWIVVLIVATVVLAIWQWWSGTPRVPGSNEIEMFAGWVIVAYQGCILSWMVLIFLICRWEARRGTSSWRLLKIGCLLSVPGYGIAYWKRLKRKYMHNPSQRHQDE